MLQLGFVHLFADDLLQAAVARQAEEIPLLDTSTDAIGGVVAPAQVENLPMLGRNSNSLMVLEPGVVATRQTTANPVLETHYQFFSINGSRPNQSQFLLDGGDDTNLGFNGPEYTPGVEEVQEYRIQTSNFSAEYGNSAARAGSFVKILALHFCDEGNVAIGATVAASQVWVGGQRRILACLPFGSVDIFAIRQSEIGRQWCTALIWQIEWRRRRKLRSIFCAWHTVSSQAVDRSR